MPAVQASLQALLAAVEAQMEQVQHQIRAHVTRYPALTRRRGLCLHRDSFRQTFGVYRPHLDAPPVWEQRAWPPTRLSKISNARVRKALYWAAIAALWSNPLICAFGHRLRARGKATMVVIGAAMRKLAHLAYGVLKTGTASDKQHVNEHGICRALRALHEALCCPECGSS